MAVVALRNTSLFSDANLAYYWEFEGNSNDSKDSLNGTDLLISYGSNYGKFDQGASFNGSSSISLGTSDLVSTSFSLHYWIYPTSSGSRCICDFNTAGGDFIAYQLLSTDKVMIGFRGAPEIQTPNSSLTINAWNHIVMTYNNGAKNDTASFKIYINGVDKTLNTSSSIGGATVGNWLGADTGLAAYTGYLDDFAIFNDVLTAAEALGLYDGSLSTIKEAGHFMRMNKYW